AATLVRQGIPAVLANQYAISDAAAIELSCTFYKALTEGLSVDMAVSEARKAIALQVANTMEWAVPALHMHTPDGVLFHLPQVASPSSRPSSASTSGTTASSSSMAPLFVSYSRKDQEAVTRLYEDLQRFGVTLWIDHKDILPGSPDWENVIRTALRSSSGVLWIVTPHILDSPYVKDELDIAKLYQRPIYPLWIEGSEWLNSVPLGWGRIQYLDARAERYEMALVQLVQFVKKQPSSPSSPSQAPKLESPVEPRNPYKGLHFFTTADVGDFFGREQLITELVNNVKKALEKDPASGEEARLVAVIGPSGSGKSSAVLAGLLPRLHQNALPASHDWIYLERMVPGAHPLEALARTLAYQFPARSHTSLLEDLTASSARGLHLLAEQLAQPSQTRVVLFIDQFEELFTQTTDAAERAQFLNLLTTAVTEPHGSLLIFLTLRADFYDRPMQYPDLHRLLQAHQVSVLSMESADLRKAIEQPAALLDVQLSFEEDLVGDLLFELRGQVGALPLLEFTLDQLFQRRNGRQLTRQAYQEIGGVKGALAKHAESTYAALPSDEYRRLARALFLRLIDPGATEQDTTRRRASLSEFALADATQNRLLQETADAFIAARLLTTNEVAGITTLEVSHEALIREWPRLIGWLREARDDITLQQSISEDAADWVRRGGPADRLYRGSQLVEAHAWAERNVPSRDEVAFLQASQDEEQQEKTLEQERQVRELLLQRSVVSRQRLLVIALSIFLVVVIIAGTFAGIGFLQANAQRQQAETQTQIASSRALAAQANYALMQNKLDRALLLSIKANQTYNTFDARDSLLTALEYSPRLFTILEHGPGLGSLTNPPILAFSSDGQTLASFTPYSSEQWNIKTRKLSPSHFTFQLNSHIGLINSFLASPDGQILAATGDTGLWVENTTRGTDVVQLVGDTQGIPPLPNYSYSYPAIAFSPDGKTLASSRCAQYTAQGGGHVCTQGRILLWDVASEKPTSRVLISQGGIAIGMAFSPDGKTLASSNLDGTVQLWNVASKSLSGQFSIGHTQDFFNFSQQQANIAFSPDGKLLACGNSDGTITLWDTVSQKLVGSPLIGHAGGVEQLAFSRDGNMLASGSDDKTLLLWNIERNPPYPYPVFIPVSQPLRGHPGSISSLAFSPDNKMLASSDTTGAIILWNVAVASSIKQELEYQNDVHSATFSPDGNVIIAGDDKGKITLREATTGKLLDTLDATMAPMSIPNSQPYDDGPLTIKSLALSLDGHILAAG
ncbi:MAG: TIR domain-containing protein, partial [Chloroflexi bacterium]|nr:TIR domain-containing protein [Chloroflexota bacterium]